MEKDSDSLLTKGHTPNYGITDSYRDSESPNRWRVVALCAFTACIASLVAGMSLSYSSIIINELSSTPGPVQQNWHISNNGTEAILIGVCTTGVDRSCECYSGLGIVKVTVYQFTNLPAKSPR